MIRRCLPTGTRRCRAPTFPFAPRGSFQAQLDHFVEVARGLAEPLVSAEDASRTLALVEAATLAARTSATVDVARFRADIEASEQS